MGMLDNVPLEDFNWLIEIFATMTDNTDTYDFVFYEDSETLPGHLKRICSVDKIYLANFLNEDQGYESGISMYGHYIACKCPDISSEEEYMNQLTDIRYNITTMNILYHIIRIILSVGTILIPIRNEDIYQAHKHTHPTNDISSHTPTLIIYTIALITLPHRSRYPE